jgi:HlyD family secretion protein
MKRKTLVLLTLILAATISLGAFYSNRGGAAPVLTTAAVTRGSIVTVVSATGTLQAVTTVQVGSQVSGSVEALFADFNAMVRKGQVLARLDQSTYATAVDQAQASLVSAEAEAERLRVGKWAADAALARARDLSAKQLLPAADLESAETAARSAASQVVGGDARVVQARSAVRTAQVNLAKTVIASPIDGVVIARNVDVGQTVAASLSAPTLFVIAADLSRMQLNASIDESDLGQIRQDQAVTFRVDAYPSDTFTGTVSQVRLNPTTLNNVVTYAAIIDAPNAALKLKPGMTANATIEVARRDDVVRVPAAALRFKPEAGVLAHFSASAAQTPKGPVVWVSNGTTIAPVPVKPGASDGTFTEILGDALAEGALLVTRAASASSATSPSAAAGGGAGNPLMPATRAPARR